MSNESMESRVAAWLEKVKELSVYRRDYLDCCPPDDSFGWGERLRYKLRVPAEKLFRMSGLLLMGNTGCGRHTAAAHAVQFLRNDWADMNQEEQGFEAVWLAEESLDFLEDFGSKSVYECLNTLLDAYAGLPICLVVEFPEQSGYCAELMRHLGRFSCMYAAYAGQEGGFTAPLFLIVITDEEERLPRQLRERLHCCRMQLPSYEQRLQFLHRQSRDSELEDVFDPGAFEELAEMTERMNYAQLRDLTQNLIACAGCDYERDALLAVAESQLPQEPPKAARQRMYGKINDFLDALPELLQNLPAAVPHAPAAQEEAAHAEETERKQDWAEIPADLEAIRNASGRGVDRQKFEEQTSHMTTHAILNDIFGEAEASALLSSAAQLSVKA